MTTITIEYHTEQEFVYPVVSQFYEFGNSFYVTYFTNSNIAFSEPSKTARHYFTDVKRVIIDFEMKP